MSGKRFGYYYKTNGNSLLHHYKNHLSDIKDWEQKIHTEDWLRYANNVEKYLSLDETYLSNGELYTILTNKDRHEKKGISLLS